MSWTEDDVRRFCERTGQPLPHGMAIQDKKPSKYRNKRTEANGRVYDSAREAKRATELRLLVQSGEAAALFEQVPFHLPGGIVYKADFVILQWDGTFTIEDSKGVLTKEYRLKKRLMAAQGLTITEV